jgi:hypothetical protein
MLDSKTRAIRVKSGIVKGFSVVSKINITLDDGEKVVIDISSPLSYSMPVFGGGEKYIQVGDVLMKLNDEYFLVEKKKFNDLFEAGR